MRLFPLSSVIEQARRLEVEMERGYSFEDAVILHAFLDRMKFASRKLSKEEMDYEWQQCYYDYIYHFHTHYSMSRKDCGEERHVREYASTGSGGYLEAEEDVYEREGKEVCAPLKELQQSCFFDGKSDEDGGKVGEKYFDEYLNTTRETNSQKRR